MTNIVGIFKNFKVNKLLEVLPGGIGVVKKGPPGPKQFVMLNVVSKAEPVNTNALNNVMKLCGITKPQIRLPAHNGSLKV